MSLLSLPKCGAFQVAALIRSDQPMFDTTFKTSDLYQEQSRELNPIAFDFPS